MSFRDYRFLGMTQSLCPTCLKLVQAKIICREQKVYFRKYCPEHGMREDMVCSDVDWFDRSEFSLPGKQPLHFRTSVSKGCPYDCGLCTEHEQHTCIGLLEITSHCNLECPVCFANSGPGGKHLSVTQCRAAIDTLVEAEGEPEVLQLSGGEPTIHPQFLDILEYACQQPIDVVMINTNGIRIARDPAFVEKLCELKHRLEIYFQFDSFDDDDTGLLRGQSLVETKLKALEVLGKAGIRTTLVCTLQRGVNENEIGRLVDFAVGRRWVTGVSFQPTTYTGRYFLPDDEERITFPEVLQRIESQTNGRWRQDDFSPLPCAHPNAHTVGYTFRDIKVDGGVDALPLARFVDLENHLELLSGRITYNRDRTKELVETFLANTGCSMTKPGNCEPKAVDELATLLDAGFGSNADAKDATGATDKEANGLVGQFIRQALTQTLAPEDMLRITTTSFMDPYNFDVRQLMKSCVHQVLPTGHIIPFSAYNIFYREGQLPLPKLNKQLHTLSAV